MDDINNSLKQRSNSDSPSTPPRPDTLKDIANSAGMPSENPNPVFRLSNAGRVLFTNDAGYAMLRHGGITADNEAPQPWRDLMTSALSGATRNATEIEVAGHIYSFTVVPAPDRSYVSFYGIDITPQKMVENALHESLERYRLLFENSMDGILLTTPDGGVLAANAAACRIYGRSEEEICRVGRSGLVDLSDPRVQLAMEERERTGKFNTEFFSLRGDGSRFPSEVSSTVFKGEDGRLRTSLIVHDITERTKRKEELQRLNRTLRAHSHSDQALMRATTESEYLAEVCKIVAQDCGHAMVWIGYAEEDENKTVRPVAYAGFEEGYLETLRITWADTERGRGPTGTAIRTGKPCSCRNMLTDPEFAPWREEALRRGYASSLALPLLADSKAFGALTIYSRDPDPFSEEEVTLLSSLTNDLAYGIRMIRLRLAHAQATEALRRYQLLADHSRDIILFMRHDDGRLLEVNAAACNAYGYNREELLKLTIQDLRAPDTQVLTRAQMAQAAAHGILFETIHQRKDGSAFPVEVSSQGATIGDTLTLISVVRDISERKRTEQALAHLLEAEANARSEAERANELKLKFLAMISHELRTPLQSIKGFTTTLLADDITWDDATQRDFLRTIDAESDKLTEMIEQLLDVSRLQAGTLRVNLETQPLQKIVAAARPQIEALAQRHVLGVNVPDDLPAMRADRQRIIQVLINLVSNAAKYSPPGKAITLSARHTDGYIEVSVSDEGPGIPASEQPRLFEAFYRGSDSRIERIKGAGLGLSICKGLIAAHGGRIWIQDHTGPGATVSFTVPVA